MKSIISVYYHYFHLQTTKNNQLSCTNVDISKLTLIYHYIHRRSKMKGDFHFTE